MQQRGMHSKNRTAAGRPILLQPGSKCQAGEGNCQTNNDCKEGLKCIENAGAKYGYASNVNVCEAPINIYNQSGWKCKNQNTMAYLLSDGTWTNELQCKHGCSNGSCYMPPFCDAITNNLVAAKNKGAILLFSEEKKEDNPKTALFIYQTIAAPLLETVFTTVAVGLFAIIGIIMYTNSDGTYLEIPWPEYNGWTSESNLTSHFNTHAGEFGYQYLYQFEDACKKNYESSDSLTSKKYIEQSDQGNVFIVRNIISRMVSMVNEQGKMIACYTVGETELNSKLKNKGWKAIPKLPSCYMLI